MTNTIYAGYLSPDGTNARMKKDVTQQVKNAMMQYMHVSGETLLCQAGELRFTPTEEEIKNEN